MGVFWHLLTPTGLTTSEGGAHRSSLYFVSREPTAVTTTWLKPRNPPFTLDSPAAKNLELILSYDNIYAGVLARSLYLEVGDRATSHGLHRARGMLETRTLIKLNIKSSPGRRE